MAEETIIAWTSHTFNAWMGCQKVSPGCAHCYAETLTKNRMGLQLWGPTAPRQVTAAANWRKPIGWNREAQESGKRSMVFCGSLMDWAEDHPTAIATLQRLWQLIRVTPWLDWQLLTKRAERIAESLPADWGEGYPNVWLGVSIENMDYAHRAATLAKIRAAVRFISYEPALGPLGAMSLDGIDWLICGGESGPGYRPMPMEWSREMRDKCRAAGVAYFHKQSSGYRTELGTTLDGETVREYPTPRRPSSNTSSSTERSLFVSAY
jgi:protein gp37